MSLGFSFITSCFLFWGIALSWVGCPGLQRGPWTLERMTTLKHTELSLYGAAVFFIPGVAILLSHLLQGAGLTLERSLHRPFPRLTRYGPYLLSPWLLILFFLKKAQPSWTVFIAGPFLLSLLLFSGLLLWDWLTPQSPSLPSQKIGKNAERASETSSRSRIHLFLAVLLPVLLFLMNPRSLLNRPIEFADEGLRVAAANQAAHGKQPYKDIFFQYGPGTEIIQPWVAFELFGKSLAAHRQLEAWIESSGYVATLLLASVVLRNPLTCVLLAAIFLGRLDLWIGYRVTLPFLSLALLLVSWKLNGRARRISALGAGLLSGMAYVYSLEGGLLTIASIGSFFLLRRVLHRNQAPPEDEMGSYGLGVLGVMLPWIFWVTAAGAFGSWISNTFLVGDTLLSAWGKPTPPLCEPLVMVLTQPSLFFHPQGALVRWWFPLFLYLGVLTFALTKKGDKELLLLSVSGIFFFTIVMGRTDYDHWIKATPLVWLLASTLLERGGSFVIRSSFPFRSPGRWIPQAATTVGLFLLLKYILGPMSWTQAGQRIMHPSLPSRSVPTSRSTLARLGGLSLGNEEKELTAVVQRIHQRVPVGQPLYVLGDYALLYFLADRINPTRYANLSFVVGDAMVHEVLYNLDMSRPPCIVTRRADLQKLSIRSYHQPLVDFIAENYSFDQHVGPFSFFVPKWTKS